MPDHYRPRLDSEVADIKNVTASRDGGALAAGLFLREFVGEGIPWAHLDIAGPMDAESDEGIYAKGATGYGTRLLIDLAVNFQKPA